MAELPEKSAIDVRRERGRWEFGLDQADLAQGKEPLHAFQPAGLNIEADVKKALLADLKECRLSRQQVADALTMLSGHDVGLAQLEHYLAETKPHRFPAHLIPAWVRVTGSRRLLILIAAEAGLWLADAEEHDLADLGRASLQREKLDKRVVELRTRLVEKV